MVSSLLYTSLRISARDRSPAAVSKYTRMNEKNVCMPNWQKINSEVKEELGQEQMEKLMEAVNQGQIIKQYQQTEAYYESMRRQLAEHEQFIKETEQRALESQKAAELQQKKVQLEMKKRRIIYI